MTRHLRSEISRMSRETKVKEIDEEHGIELLSTPVGDLWVTSGSRRSSFEHMLAEIEIGAYGSPGVRAGDVVIDCGANHGVFANRALRDGAHHVVACEPVPLTCECLERSFKEESDRVTIVRKGVWSSEEIMTFTLDPVDPWCASTRVSGSTAQLISLPVTTVDSIVSELELPVVTFMKMDIEGAEKEAIRGARETLREYKPRLAITVYHNELDRVEVPELVTSINADYRVTKWFCEDRLTKVVSCIFTFE